jgi:hypothetical protein
VSTAPADHESCPGCGLHRAISVINAHLWSAYLANLVAAVEEIRRLRVALREVIALADDAPTVTDSELAGRLVTLATACGQLVNTR